MEFRGLVTYKWPRYKNLDYMVRTIHDTDVDYEHIEEFIAKYRKAAGYLWELHTIYATPYPRAKTVFVFKKVGEE